MQRMASTRRQALKTLAGIGAGLGAGLAGFGPARAGEVVNMGVLKLASHAPSYIAVDRGYFVAEGLDVAMKFFEAAQPMAVAIAAGDVDYGATALSGALINLADKGAIKVIGGALKEEKGITGSLILASGKAFEAGLTSPAKLPGHSFGITTAGSSFHYMAYKIAEANHFALSQMTLKPLQKLGAIVAAMTSGQIDAWAVQANVAKKLTTTGGAREIGLVSEVAPDYQVTAMFASAKNAGQARDKTERFLRAYSRAVDDYNAAFVDKTSGPDEVKALAAIVHKYLDPDTPADVAFADLTDGAMRISKGLAMSTTSLTDQLNWFKSEKMVKDTITPELLFDTSYVKTL
ncbi:MAG: ABC transporter substrate-binding protein [Ancalomicrobiaceae bacterium]|nr:ABC transporter substrate-binding protein [Ancalomicrobiaceae bacterium]